MIHIATAYVRGAFAQPTGAEIPIIYPGDGARIGTLHEDDAGTVDQAVRAARTAFDQGDWPRLGTERRQALLLKARDAILANVDELARLECLNTGVPMRQLRDRHMRRAAYNFQFFAEFIGQVAGKTYGQAESHLTFVTREPVGVAALIAPWNAPVALASMKIAAAIAFGNTCVVKPSEQTPLALARLVQILTESGIPPGVINLVNGRGPVTGSALVAHDGVDLVSFTGGTETGKAIMAAAGAGLKPVTMELGGKSANIIFESADIETALDGALVGILSNNGQQCLAGSRILVQRSIADRFIERFVARARRVRIDDPMDPATEIGPLAFAAHRDRVLGFVDTARRDGATLLTGGKALDRPGFFIEPTAVLAPSNDARVAQEEIFGPFATFIKFDAPDDAIAIANRSRFGLVAYAWTRDLDLALRCSRAIRAGVVWINTPMMRELRAPFGGFKQSGVGREGGESCLQFYTAEKATTIATGAVAMPRLGLT